LALCFLSIICSATLAVLAIWDIFYDKEVLWRALATLGVVFFASLATLVVNKAAWYAKRERDAQ